MCIIVRPSKSASRRRFRSVRKEPARLDPRSPTATVQPPSERCVCRGASVSSDPSVDVTEWVSCESGLTACPGNGYYHLTCLGFTTKCELPAGPFICPGCVEATSAAWEREQQSVVADDAEDLPPGYFVPESIVGHRKRPCVEREFLVKWKDYDSAENTWQEESTLRRVWDLVHVYCQLNANCGSIRIKPLGGAACQEDADGGVGNWVSPSDVMRKIVQETSTPTYRTDV